VKPTSNLELTIAHLNAPVGPVLTVDHLAKILRSGSVAVLADEPAVVAIASYLFVETDPRLISLCATEANADMAHVNMFYQETLRLSVPAVPAWEKAVEFLL
jgi:hypothetical protein